MESHKSAPFWLLMMIVLLVIGGMVFLLLGNPSTDKQRTTPQSFSYMNAPATYTVDAGQNFTDGLHNPNETRTYKLDKSGAGKSKQTVYYIDINKDNIQDKITRAHYETGTSHFWDEYTIELLQDGIYRDITPENLHTVHGADCALTLIKFVFTPKFQVIKISRPWQESWNTPSVATRTVYELTGDKMSALSQQQLRSVCDVADLFLTK